MLVLRGVVVFLRGVFSLVAVVELVFAGFVVGVVVLVDLVFVVFLVVVRDGVVFFGVLFLTGFLSLSSTIACLVSLKRSINRSLSLVSTDHDCSLLDFTISSSFLRRDSGIESYFDETYAITGAKKIHGSFPTSFMVCLRPDTSFSLSISVTISVLFVLLGVLFLRVVLVEAGFFAGVFFGVGIIVSNQKGIYSQCTGQMLLCKR